MNGSHEAAVSNELEVVAGVTRFGVDSAIVAPLHQLEVPQTHLQHNWAP